MPDTPAAPQSAALHSCRPGLQPRRSRDRQFARGAEGTLECEIAGTDAKLLADEGRQGAVSQRNDARGAVIPPFAFDRRSQAGACRENLQEDGQSIAFELHALERRLPVG